MRRIVSISLVVVGGALAFVGARSFLLSRLPVTPVETRAAPSLPPVEGTACCVLEVPRLGVRQDVIEGTRIRDLERAPGHFIRSAAPGEPGNCAITAHRDTHFRFVHKLRKSDRLRVTYRRRTFEYAVVWTRVIEPAEVGVLDATTGATLTLLSCYPFTYVGPAPKRFAVRAVLVK